MEKIILELIHEMGSLRKQLHTLIGVVDKQNLIIEDLAGDVAELANDLYSDGADADGDDFEEHIAPIGKVGGCTFGPQGPSMEELEEYYAGMRGCNGPANPDFIRAYAERSGADIDGDDNEYSFISDDISPSVKIKIVNQATGEVLTEFDGLKTNSIRFPYFGGKI